MLTTTPFFRPREGCEPMPSTSTVPSRPASPTSAMTFEVPISSPMIRLLSERLGIARLISTFGLMRGTAPPADGESVRITHIDIGDVGRPLSDDLQSRRHERLEALVDSLATETHRDPVVQIEL